MTNIVVANLAKSRFYRCPPLYQYNYGMVLRITGVDLPDAYQVDFSNDVSGTSITQVGGADGVTIPSQFFIPGQAIYCWLRVHPTQDSGITTATIVIPISPRATITDEEPTPEEQSAIDEAIAALNDAVDKAEDAVEHYPQITNGVWYVWDVDAGEYISTGISATGPQGETGATGAAGADGFSPTATVTQTASGATISITDKTGTTTANIVNGQDGAPGVGVPSGGTTGQVLSKASGTDYDTEWATPEAGGVTDVQVNGTSVVTSGVANVPVASSSTSGVVKTNGTWGISMHTQSGEIRTDWASTNNIKSGNANTGRVIVPYNQHESVFYGLAKAAGSDEKNSTLSVGQYTDAAKSAIKSMIGVGEWDNIGNVTLTEETNSVTITADRTYYEVYAYIDIKAASATTSLAFTVKNDAGNNIRGQYFGSQVNTTEKITLVRLESMPGMSVMSYNNDNAASQTRQSISLNELTDYGIKTIVVGAYGGTVMLPVGSVIKVYAR